MIATMTANQIVLNTVSALNTISKDETYVLTLNGVGYLSESTTWRADFEAGQDLDIEHFRTSEISEFSLADAQNMLASVKPSLKGSARILRKTTIVVLEELAQDA